MRYLIDVKLEDHCSLEDAAWCHLQAVGSTLYSGILSNYIIYIYKRSAPLKGGDAA
jgi:hypothetical protein